MTKPETIRFQNADGETLAARLDFPVGPVKAYALFAHCFTCSKDIIGARGVSRALAARGYAVLRFDFTGLGQSEGDFSDTTFSSNVDDLLRAAEHLRQNYEAPKLLVGHSLGGAAVLAAANRVPEALAVATIAAPSAPDHVKRHLDGKIDEIEADGEAVVDLGGRPFRIRKSFVDDLSAHAVLDEVAAMKKALLVMHAPLDDTVSVSNATDIFIAARHPKSFVSLDDADHLLSRKQDADYAGGVLAAWAERFVGSSDVAEAESEDGWAVSRTAPGATFAQDIAVGGHLVRADADAAEGGDGTGPNPTQLAHAALAACGGITAHMYARRKKWPLEAVEIAVRGAPGGDQHVNTVMEKRVRLSGDLDDEQKARITEIIDKCPVHRMLAAGVDIRHTDER